MRSRKYGNDANRLIEHLDLLTRPPGGDPKPVDLDLPLLRRLVPFILPIASDFGPLDEFQAAWHKLKKIQTTSNALERWRNDYVALARLLDDFKSALSGYSAFVDRFDAVILQPFREGGPDLERGKLTLKVDRSLREQIDDGRAKAMFSTFNQLINSTNQFLAAHEERHRRTLSEWKAADSPWKEAMSTPVEASQRQLDRLSQDQKTWRQKVKRSLDRLREYERWTNRTVLGAWDEAESFRTGWLRWLFFRSTHVKMRFNGAQILEGSEHDPKRDLDTLRTLRLGPGATAWATIAMADLSSLRAASTRSG